jgi:hypothetical protein
MLLAEYCLRLAQTIAPNNEDGERLNRYLSAYVLEAMSKSEADTGEKA